MLRTQPIDNGWTSFWTSHQGTSDAVPPVTSEMTELPAAVPGDVHLDLMRAGILPDLYVGENLMQAAWVEDKDWWYRTAFTAPATKDGERVLLVFHGLDTFATVQLNGTVIGHTDNMHRRYTFDVTEYLQAAGNTLTVRLASPRYAIPFDPAHGPVMWSPERLFARKAQMSFGWDIAPRLVTRGIWRPVELVIVDGARLADVWVTLGQADDVTVHLAVERHGHDGPLRVTGNVAGEPFSAELAAGEDAASVRLALPGAPRWQPVGYGTPALLDVDATLFADARALDTRHFHTGLRTVELCQDPLPSGGLSFTFKVNGRTIFVTGLNWTPLDAIFARVTPEQITARLEALARLGCNMLRVWGGGIYEPEHFYAECDRLGIMIWQDFMMACGWYPQTDAMAMAFDAEARQIVHDLRHHPCLALWAGDNEVDAVYPDLAPLNRLTRQVLADVCAELHPQVPYLPSSPYRPTEPAGWYSDTEGDSHVYDHGTNYRESAMWTMRPLFTSEFGHLSLPDLATIRTYFPPGTEWPLDNEMWRFHGSDTIQSGMFRVTDRVLKALAACGKPAPRTIEEAVPASQALQTEAVLGWIAQWDSAPYFGGFLLWNVHDCWPQMSDAVFDYLGHPKQIFAELGSLYARLRAEHDNRTRHEGEPHA